MVHLICGFMGSGKSTLLRRRWGDQGVDLDDYMLQNTIHPHTIPDFVDLFGWPTYRHLERQSLKQLLKAPPKALALGGGSLDWELLKEIKKTPWIRLWWVNTDFETCWERMKNGPPRPLMALGPGACRELFQKRIPLYQEAHRWV